MRISVRIEPISPGPTLGAPKDATVTHPGVVTLIQARRLFIRVRLHRGSDREQRGRRGFPIRAQGPRTRPQQRKILRDWPSLRVRVRGAARYNQLSRLINNKPLYRAIRSAAQPRGWNKDDLCLNHVSHDWISARLSIIISAKQSVPLRCRIRKASETLEERDHSGLLRTGRPQKHPHWWPSLCRC